jgi:hypothetical protein
MEIIFDKMRALFYGWYDVRWGKKSKFKANFPNFCHWRQWPILGGGNYRWFKKSLYIHGENTRNKKKLLGETIEKIRGCKRE